MPPFIQAQTSRGMCDERKSISSIKVVTHTHTCARERGYVYSAVSLCSWKIRMKRDKTCADSRKSTRFVTQEHLGDIFVANESWRPSSSQKNIHNGHSALARDQPLSLRCLTARTICACMRVGARARASRWITRSTYQRHIRVRR